MTLTDPRDALAEQSNFVSYLMGLAESRPEWCMRWPRRRPPRGPAVRSRRLRSRAARCREPRRDRSSASPNPRGQSRMRDASPPPAPTRQVAAMTATLASSDFLRAPVLATAQPDGIQGVAPLRGARRGSPALDQLQPHQRNVSHRPTPAGAARHRDRRTTKQWTGAIERFDDSELDVSADLGDLTIGGNRMIVRPDGYQVVIDLPGQDIRGRARLHIGESTIRRQQSAGGGRPDVLAVRAEAARRRMAAHRRPRASRGRRAGVSRPQLGPLLVGRRLRLDLGHNTFPRLRGTRGRWSSCG